MSLRNFVPPRGKWGIGEYATAPDSLAVKSNRPPTHGPSLSDTLRQARAVLCAVLVLVLVSVFWRRPVSDQRGSAVSLDGEWRLHLVTSPSAVCLDGSAPGYYVREGRGSSRRRWLIQ